MTSLVEHVSLRGDVSKRLRFIAFRKVVYNHLNIIYNM